MIREALIKWAVAAMTAIQPVAVTPWADTYEASATTIVKVAEEMPVWPGADSTQRTVATLISLGWFEGRLKQDAKGDCLNKTKDGKQCDPVNPQFQSFCMFQIGKSNFKGLDVTEERILADFELCTRTAVRMIMLSKNVCKGRPDTELLGNYASGKGVCGGLTESKHRMTKAKWVFANVKTPE
jgi:hypothetical protein